MAIGIELDSGFIRPDINPQRSVTTRVNTATFGDGYEYRLPIGFNVLGADIRLTFNNRAVEKIDELETFLEDKMGSISFSYTFIRGEASDGTVKEQTISVVCDRWRVTNRTGDIASLSCDLRRVYG